MKNKNLALVLATALVLGACGNQAAKPAEETKTEESQVAENKDAVKEVSNKAQTSAKDPIPATEKTLEEAIDAFYTHFGDDAIELTGAGFDEEDGKYCYEINGFKDGQEYELVLDANTLEVISENKEAEDDNTIMAIDRASLITGKEAMEKALEDQADGVYVEGYELEVENGKAIYDIDLENASDVKIDAASGEIIK
ncbi:PepSY domain-containing protein [Anaerococcus murdochii]|uniref:PepSY domain-containing protein n=1 Tax=Anaerococcus murdochii TaxID=411577 RepID=A0ABS7SXP1_9FIRM|nr:PepSY domain-containing protein [Anaerococcus murdochii]MBZ2386309.1 PepSY domain-containing protein [Anaerococcus murdochii]